MIELPRPKKSFGQNFLSDPAILNKIVAAGAVKPDDQVLEVGPGRGALTRLLAAAAGQVIAVELDGELLPILRQEFQPGGSVTVVAGDILQIDLEALLTTSGTQRWKVIANLPYYISTQVLFQFLDHRHLFSRMVLMLQREVGERLAAGPGSKTYGALSVLCQLHFMVKNEFIVRPGAFFPPPKVDSVVVSFIPRAEPVAEVGDEQVFRLVVKAAFSQRRKTLFNCLKSGLPLATADIQAVLADTAIDGQRRAETLSVVEFATLSLNFCPGLMGKVLDKA